MLWALVPALWVMMVATILLVYRRELLRVWREPVLRHPVLILESDDWGAGPLEQAKALRDIAHVLARHRDASGRLPVMSLALVLAVPDGPAIRAGASYRRVEFDDPRFAAVLAALRSGRDGGVFALQLHGLEHYWPPALLASGDPAVAAWLRGDVPAATERLPSHLQSRWVDAARLPSAPHADLAVEAAAAEEVRTYTRIVGEAPAVVVPPTFVWTRVVERAWAQQGVAYVVTPGWRYTRRDAQGQPGGDEGPIANGDRDGTLTYLARCDYFEPMRGRDATHALGVLARMAAEGRACLLENHRDNFLGDSKTCRRSLNELDELMRQAIARHADLRFLSTREFGAILRERDLRWLLTRPRARLPFVWRRLAGTGRPWKLLVLTGAAALGSVLVSLLAHPPLPKTRGSTA
jgi:hypothetical protein